MPYPRRATRSLSKQLANEIKPTANARSTKTTTKPKSKSKSKSTKAQPSSDPITNLLLKLPQQYKDQINPAIQPQLVTKTKESLRLFNTKLSHGQKLHKIDSSEARGVVVLEYILRQGIVVKDGTSASASTSASTSNGTRIGNSSNSSRSSSVRVPISVLGKIVGIGKKDIEDFGRMTESMLGRMNMSSSSLSKTSSKTSSRTTSRSHLHGTNKHANIIRNRNSANVIRGALKNDVHKRNVARVLARGSRSNLKSNIILAGKITKKDNSHNNDDSGGGDDDSNFGTGNKRIRTRNPQNNFNNTDQKQQQKQQQQQQQQIKILVSSSKHIQTLSIKLQSYLHDPDTIEQKSKILWHNIIQYKLKDYINSRMRKGVLYDLESNIEYYEGACFYYTVYDLEHGCMAMSLSNHKNGSGSSGSGSNNNRSTGMKRNNNNEETMDHNDLGNNNNNNNNNSSNMEEQDLTMTIDDIINELRIDHHTFKLILEEVSLSAKAMGRHKYSKDDDDDDDGLESKYQHQDHQKRLTTKKRSRNVNDQDSENSNHASKRTKMLDNGNIVLTTGEENGNDNYDENNKWNTGKNRDCISTDTGTGIPSNGKAKYVSKEKLLEWKEKIFHDIILSNSASSSGLKSDGGSDKHDFSSTRIDKLKIMRKYAHDILQQYKDKSK